MSFKHPYTAAFLGGDRQPMSGAAMTSEGLPAETGIISVDAVGMRTLNLAEKIVMTSGVEDMLARWRTEDGADPSKGGRPSIISDTTVLILMSIIAIESRPMHLQQAVDIITRRASNDVLRRLGLPERDKDDYTSAAGLHAWYMRLHRAWNRVRSVVDPYPEVSYHERMTKDEFDAVVKMRDVAAIQAKMKRLAALDNALIMASVAMMPAEHQGAWAGDVCVDGTPIPTAKKGTTRLGQLASSEPDAGWYVRDGEHRGDEQRDGVSKLMWAYEATIATQTFAADDKGTPSLIVGKSMDKPGHRIAENAVQSLDHLIADPSAPKGHFMGDRAYLPGAKAEKLALPLRGAGYKMMGDLSVASRGLNTTYEGAELIDGTWYFPGMPADWKTASVDYYNGTITMEELTDIVDKRQAFALIPKFIDYDGSVTYKSPLRDKWAKLRFDGIEPHPNAKSRKLTKIFRKNLPKRIEDTAVWQRKQLRIPADAGAKYAQQGPAWGTQEWADIYRRGRNTIESRNRLLKNNRLALGDHTRRLVRGFANAALVVALGIVAVNIHLIDSFIKALSTGTLRAARVGRQAQCERFTSIETTRDMAGNDPPVVA